MMNSSIQVAVYDDRVEISSPGSLYGSLTLQEALSGRSSIRNKILASVCEKLNVIEGWGTGLKRIIDICKEKNVNPPEFMEIGDLLRVNFYRPSYKKSATNTKVGDKSAISSENKILEYLKSHNEAKSQEIADCIGLKISRTKDYLSKLVSEKKIEAIGGNKNRTYKIVKENCIK